MGDRQGGWEGPSENWRRENYKTNKKKSLVWFLNIIIKYNFISILFSMLVFSQGTVLPWKSVLQEKKKWYCLWVCRGCPWSEASAIYGRGSVEKKSGKPCSKGFNICWCSVAMQTAVMTQILCFLSRSVFMLHAFVSSDTASVCFHLVAFFSCCSLVSFPLAKLLTTAFA